MSDFKVEPLDDGRSKGGQYAYPNERSSGVRITFLPTGQSEEEYSEKSQLRNREIAMRRLMARVEAGS